MLKDGEIRDDLGRAGLKIIRKKGAYAYTADSVLLADFAGVKRNDSVCDLGAGDGILMLLLAGRCCDITCDGIERDIEAAERAQRSIRYNHLTDRLRIFGAAFDEAKNLLPMGAYSLIVSNPPYFLSAEESEKSAPDGTLNDLLSAASHLLNNRGRLALCYPAGRIMTLLPLMHRHHLEPKCLRFVHGKPGRDAYLVLVRSVKNARPGLIVRPPLFLRDESGNETEEVRRIYNQAYSDAESIVPDENAIDPIFTGCP